MSISIVNGYLCFDSCEAAKAESGKDPRTQPGQLENGSAADRKSDGARGVTSATTIASSLSALLATDAVATASVATASKTISVKPALDVRA